jgi:hypothetical protein
MTARITQNMLESYVFWKYKGYLQGTGEHGMPSDYARFLTQSRDEVRRKATAQILAQSHKGQVVQGGPLTAAVLRHGPLFVWEARVEDGPFCLVLDGRKHVPGVSTLGAFHYLPMLCTEGRQIRREQRLLARTVWITPLPATREDPGQRHHLAWPSMSRYEGASVS